MGIFKCKRIAQGEAVTIAAIFTAQCRDWLKNIVNFMVFRSNTPVWSNRRGITQTLTQVTNNYLLLSQM